MTRTAIAITSLIVLVAVVAGGVAYYATHKAQPAASSDTASSTPQSGVSADSAATDIVGTWTQGSSASLTFAADGTVTEQGADATRSGTWQLYNADTKPADLAGLVLEPAGVFLRLSYQDEVRDFKIVTLTQQDLELVNLGRPGSFVFSRSR